MTNFSEHFRFSEQDAIQYIQEKLPAFFGGSPLQCKEIGDGNINYVFRITGGEKSIILKQADTCVRSSGQETSMDHNRIEAEILQIQYGLSPTHIPKIFLYDPIMCCMAMEDIGDHENMRYTLMRHQSFSTFAADMGTFLADTLIGTSSIIMATDAKKRAVERFINTDMCEISERLVFTEPYTNKRNSNKLFPANHAFLEAELYQDKPLKTEAAKLKDAFQNKAQSLIHGDLHSGSIFVKEGSTMVLDPEFAFYGPAGYDVGNVIAHLAIAWAVAKSTMPNSDEKTDFLSWIETSVATMCEVFSTRAKSIILTSGDPMCSDESFADWYIQDILSDAAGFAGTEMLRRVIGTAKVKDITEIEDEALRVYAEKIIVKSAKLFIKNRNSFHFATEFSTVLKQISEQVQ